jgi:hypothetical protein
MSFLPAVGRRKQESIFWFPVVTRTKLDSRLHGNEKINKERKVD